jgi:hypothetical protein
MLSIHQLKEIMISCRLSGGLGNYMFQIAAAYTLANRVGTEALIDLSSAIKVQGHIDKYRSNIFRKVNEGRFNNKYNYHEPSFSYNEIPLRDDMKLNGYFQSDKYIDRDIILDLYKPDNEILKSLGMSMNINTETTSIHVRRGDYLQKLDRHPPQPIEYYREALEIIKPKSNILVFSDDIEWCKDNFSDVEFIEGNPDHIDLYAMSMCKNNIIANSSFSWWAAYLNINVGKKVIAPKLWFGINKPLNTKDLIPESWTKL